MRVLVVSTYLQVLFYSVLAQDERRPGGPEGGGPDKNRMQSTPPGLVKGIDIFEL